MKSLCKRFFITDKFIYPTLFLFACIALLSALRIIGRINFDILKIVGSVVYLSIYLYQAIILLRKKLYSWLLFFTVSYCILTIFIEGVLFKNSFRFMLLIAAILLIYFALKRKIQIGRVPHGKLLPVYLFFLFWLAYCLLSTFWAENVHRTLIRAEFIFYAFLIVLFSVYSINSITRLRYLAIYIGMLTALYLFISFLEVFTGNHMISVAGEKGYKYDIMPVALMDGPNENATFLTTLGFVSAGILFFSRIPKKRMRIVLLFLFFLMLPVLYYTGSRANYIAFALVFVFIVLKSCAMTVKKGKYGIKTLVLGTIILIFLFLVIFSLYNGYKAKVDTIITKFIKSNITQNESYKIRRNLLKNGLLMLEKSHYIGVGGGNVEVQMPKYKKINPTHGITNIHNYYFEMLVDYGIPGAFALLSFYSYLLIFLIRIMKIDIRTLSVLGLLFFAEIIASIFSFDSTSSLLTRPMIWAFQGVLIAFCMIALPFTERQRRRTLSLPKGSS